VVTLVTADERSDVDKLTRQAGVRPTQNEVRPGDPALARIFGARQPSGVPIIDPPPPAQPARGGGRSRGGRSSGGRGQAAQPARQDGSPENRAARRTGLTRAAFSSAQPARRPRRPR
jgi:hypothetical protein